MAPVDSKLLLKSIYLDEKKKKKKLIYNLMVLLEPLHKILTWVVTGCCLKLSLKNYDVVIHVKSL